MDIADTPWPCNQAQATARDELEQKRGQENKRPLWSSTIEGRRAPLSEQSRKMNHRRMIQTFDGVDAKNVSFESL